MANLLSPGAAFSGESSCPASCPDGSPCLTAGLGLHHCQGNSGGCGLESVEKVSQEMTLRNSCQTSPDTQGHCPGPCSAPRREPGKVLPHRIPLFL